MERVPVASFALLKNWRFSDETITALTQNASFQLVFDLFHNLMQRSSLTINEKLNGHDHCFAQWLPMITDTVEIHEVPRLHANMVKAIKPIKIE